MNKKISTAAGILILLSIAVAISFSFLIPSKKTSEVKNKNNIISDNSTEAKPSGTETIDISEPFQFNPNEGSTYYGTLTLTGYINIEHRICRENEPCEKTVDYASLVIVSTNNNLIYDFIKFNKGNSFVGENSIGIGCYEKDAKQIYSINHSNSGSFDNIIKGKDLERILQSSASQPVTIQLSRPYLTVGGGAPECYSHFREFKVLDK